MKVVKTIIIQRKIPNDSKKSDPKSDRIATAKYGAARPYADHATIAVQPTYKARSQPADGGGRKRTCRQPQRVSLWLPASSLDTRMKTIYLMVSEARQGGDIPLLVTERKRRETALIQVV